MNTAKNSRIISKNSTGENAEHLYIKENPDTGYGCSG
jgi:hypothetical protein